MASGKEPAAPHFSQRGTAERYRGQVSMQRNSDSADDARPDGVLERRKYGLLAPEELAGHPAAARPQGSGYSPEDIMGTGGTYGRKTGTGERNRQRVLFVCSHPENEGEEPGPPERKRALNACSHQGGEVGVPPTQQLALPARSQIMEGGTRPGSALPQRVARGWGKGGTPT